jgi:hypothetical protein
MISRRAFWAGLTGILAAPAAAAKASAPSIAGVRVNNHTLAVIEITTAENGDTVVTVLPPMYRQRHPFRRVEGLQRDA